jgi:hypothetical protein
MTRFITLKLFKSFPKVHFYTFQFEDDDETETETEKFFSKLENVMELESDLNHLVVWLSLIGKKYGAKIEFFRHEAAAHALPPPMSKMIKELIVNNLRLYCVPISEQIVILANGGVKTSQQVQNAPNVLPHFRFANAMAKQIDQLIRERNFKWTGKNILHLNEIELFYEYG